MHWSREDRYLFVGDVHKLTVLNLKRSKKIFYKMRGQLDYLYPRLIKNHVNFDYTINIWKLNHLFKEYKKLENEKLNLWFPLLMNGDSKRLGAPTMDGDILIYDLLKI